MHQGYRREDVLPEIVDRFARFGLPLYFTETTLLPGDLMPPGVEDLNDYQPDEWPSTPTGGLLRADGSRKPAYDALHALIKAEWWMPPTRLSTDASGRVRAHGFLGDYRLSSHGTESVFEIARTGASAAAITL
jgi:endo-1,4-beta-xylanase